MGKGSKILRFMLFEITHLVHFYCFFMLKFFFSLEYGANNGKDNFINHYNKINTNKKYFALSVSSDPLQYHPKPFWHQRLVLWKKFFYGCGRGMGDGLGMIQAHFIYCALCFCYSISSIRSSDTRSQRLGSPAYGLV